MGKGLCGRPPPLKPRNGIGIVPAHPHPGRDSARKAEEPAVLVRTRCARLARDGPADLCSARCAGVDRSLQQVDHLRGNRRCNQHVAGVGLVLIQHFAFARRDFSDAVRCHCDAVTTDTGKSTGHVDQADVGGAQHHRGVGVDRRRDAEPPRHIGDGKGADFGAELCRHGVDRIGKGGAQTDFARIASRRIARFPAVNVDRFIDDRIAGGMSRLDRGKIDEQLERRARLADGLRRAVIDRSDIILAADHRAHRTVAVERDQCPLRFARRIRADGVVGGALHIEVERGPDFDGLTAFVDHRVELWQRPVGEVTDAVLFGFGGKRHIGGVRGGSFGGGDRPLLCHDAKNHAGATHGSFGIGTGRIVRRRLDQPRNDRRFAQRQRAGRVTEEFTCRRIDAIGAAAEINPVEIKFEHLILREFPFDGEREDHFTDLACPGPVVGQEDVACQLLRDRRSALNKPPALITHLERSNDADGINPQMAAKPSVLNSDHCGFHDVRNLVDSQPFAIARANRHDDSAVGGMDADHLAVG